MAKNILTTLDFKLENGKKFGIKNNSPHTNSFYYLNKDNEVVGFKLKETENLHHGIVRSGTSHPYVFYSVIHKGHQGYGTINNAIIDSKYHNAIFTNIKSESYKKNGNRRIPDNDVYFIDYGRYSYDLFRLPNSDKVNYIGHREDGKITVCTKNGGYLYDLSTKEITNITDKECLYSYGDKIYFVDSDNFIKTHLFVFGRIARTDSTNVQKDELSFFYGNSVIKKSDTSLVVNGNFTKRHLDYRFPIMIDGSIKTIHYVTYIEDGMLKIFHNQKEYEITEADELFPYNLNQNIILYKYKGNIFALNAEQGIIYKFTSPYKNVSMFSNFDMFYGVAGNIMYTNIRPVSVNSIIESSDGQVRHFSMPSAFPYLNYWEVYKHIIY